MFKALLKNPIVEFFGMLIIGIVVSQLMHTIMPIASFWLVFFIIFAAYVFKKLRSHPQLRWLASACLLVIAFYAQYLFFTSHLPMTHKTLPWQWVRADMALSTDTNQVKQDLVYEVFKEKHVDEVLSDEYKEKLADNDPEAAVRAAKAIRDKWDIDKINAKIKAEEDSILQAQRARQDSLQRAQIPPSPDGAPICQASETFTLHAGEQWFPTHRFRNGDSMIVTIKYAAVQHIQADGSTEIIGIGSKPLTMCTDGSPAFKGIANLAEITISYSL